MLLADQIDTAVICRLKALGFPSAQLCTPPQLHDGPPIEGGDACALRAVGKLRTLGASRPKEQTDSLTLLLLPHTPGTGTVASCVCKHQDRSCSM